VQQINTNSWNMMAQIIQRLLQILKTQVLIMAVLPGRPAGNHINVSVPTYSGISVFRVYDLNAKKILEEQISSNTVSQPIDLTKLAAGVYQVALIQGSQQQTLKLVKQ
jgi:Secretion system C-terminal sorting domain